MVSGASGQVAQVFGTCKYCYTDAVSIIETDDQLIISLVAEREPDDYWDQSPESWKAWSRLAQSSWPATTGCCS